MNAIRRKTEQRRRLDRQTGVIIHLFAAAHALTAVITRLLDYYDDIPLTILTILMIVVIAARRNLSINLTAAIIPFVTLFGYISGVWLGMRLQMLLDSPIVSYAITTFVLTEIFGWATYYFTAKSGTADIRNDVRSGYLRNIVIAACAILLLRITYSLIFRSPFFVIHGDIYAQFSRLFSNTFASLMLVCFTAILTVFPKPDSEMDSRMGKIKLIGSILCVALFPLLLTAIVYYDFPRMAASRFAFEIYAFGGLYAAALLVTIFAYLIAALLRYLAVSHDVIRLERRKNQSERYKYAKLKQQISPHFLFNSLNILDSLVQSGENERAGAYIRKLASLYRYILKNEDDQLVTLDEELEFTEKYIDLLKERFPDGLVIDKRIPDDVLKNLIVPCGLQMLIENAIKHNILSAEQPLHVTIDVEENCIAVTNNVQPRISTQPSTKLSLKNLNLQYENIAGRKITIVHTDSKFKVCLPLL